MDSLKERCSKRWSALKRERSSWMNHWREISEVLSPRTGRFLTDQNNKGYKRNEKILDSTGTRALRTLSGGMMAGLTSPARPWFRLTTLDPELDESYEVKVWMSQTTSLMQMLFNRTNLYRALHTAYEELGAYGTSATIILDDYDRVIHCMPLTIGEYAIATNARGQVNTLYREFRMTAGQMVQEFGYGNCSDFVQRCFDEHNYDAWATVVNAIEPRDMRDPTKIDNKNMPWRSVYFEPQAKNEKVLRESGFRNFPALVGRWIVTGGDIYGSSPGMESLGDLQQLQLEQERKSQAIDYMTNPPLIVPAELKDDESSILPGGMVYAGSQVQASMIRTAFDVRLDIGALLQDIADTRNRIKESFYTDIFMMLTETGRDRMTAAEVAERHEEKMLMLGPVLDRLNNEVLDPLISIVFERLVETDRLPPIPEALQNRELNVDYISILAQSQKAIATNAVDRFTNSLGVLAGMKPEVLDKVDADYWADAYADALGVDPRMIVSGKQVALIRQQRAQAQQQQASMEQLSQAAGAVKDLGGLDRIQSPNPAEVMQQFSGY